MTNHVHLIALPAREDSLSIFFRRVHGRYAQYYNACAGRSGHLWQNRFFACVLAPDHLWTALAYVERNPVRAGMVGRARDYPWSSAAAHITGHDEHDLLDMEWWYREGIPIGNSISSRLRASPTKPCGPVPMPAGPLEVKPTCKKWPSVSTVTGRRADLRKTRRPAAHQSRISSLYFEETHSSKTTLPVQADTFSLSGDLFAEGQVVVTRDRIAVAVRHQSRAAHLIRRHIADGAGRRRRVGGVLLR
jgi:hypothetical protein